MLSGKPPSHQRGETLEYLINKAGRATNIPPPPQGGIPPQLMPGFIRWPIRALLLPFVLLDIVAQKIAKWIVPPPFRQMGHCLKRGNCCHYILIEKPHSLLTTLNYFWHTEINGFYLRAPQSHQTQGKEALVMGCRYLKSSGYCGHHFLRPVICRQWPLIEYFARPQILKGCGYRSVIRYPASFATDKKGDLEKNNPPSDNHQQK